MKHSEVISLRNRLLNIKGLIGYDVNFSIKKNIQRAKASMEPLIEMEKEHSEFLKPFTDAQDKLNKDFASESGVVKYKEVNGVQQYDIPDSKLAEQKKALFDLRVEHKKLLDDYTEKIKNYAKFLDETESDFVITYVDTKFIPKDISTENFDAIFDLIEAEKEEKKSPKKKS